MPFETDNRLKSYLDANQLDRERLCLAVLALDKRFSDVRPRHPRGGPDGGRDIEAIFKKDRVAFGAVGFLNGANDSNEQKRAINKKFREDLEAALVAVPKPQVFIFLTNVSLTVGEKDDLGAEAKAASMSYCEIFDRERIRIALDEPDGFSIRFQYLGLPLSPEEQASFFAKWGDDIQSLVTSGFQRLEGTLDRVLFFQEASNVLDTLYIRLELDRTYSAEEIGHFRAFCYLILVEPKQQISQVIFGSSDRADRFSSTPSGRADVAGIKNGIGAGQWESYLDFPIIRANKSKKKVAKMTDKRNKEDKEKQLKFVQVGSSSGIGMDPVRSIVINYRHDRGHIIRYQPRIQLRDIDGAHYLPMLNRSLAEKVKAISVYANGYKLDDFPKSTFFIDIMEFKAKIPVKLSANELADPWVRIRPNQASAFVISFSNRTPLRLFSSPKTPVRPANQPD